MPLLNQGERAAILTVHVAGKHLAGDVDLDRIVRATPGFSGADLANLVNEAAIEAVRDGRTVIGPRDLDTARDRVLLGRRESSNALLPDERHAVAVHEAGTRSSPPCARTPTRSPRSASCRRAWRWASPSSCPRPNAICTARAT